MLHWGGVSSLQLLDYVAALDDTLVVEVVLDDPVQGELSGVPGLVAEKDDVRGLEGTLVTFVLG